LQVILFGIDGKKVNNKKYSKQSHKYNAFQNKCIIHRIGRQHQRTRLEYSPINQQTHHQKQYLASKTNNSKCIISTFNW
jgi:hypothetical protein